MQSLPIFHQPTFSFDLIRRELCASIFCVGLLIAPKQELHQMGCALLGQVRSGLLKVILKLMSRSILYLAKVMLTACRREHDLPTRSGDTGVNVCVAFSPSN